MDVARSARIESDRETLHFDSVLEPAKLNIGHFEGLKNVGSQFPIGEVFTEARDLEGVLANIERRYNESESDTVRMELEGFMIVVPCDACSEKPRTEPLRV